MNDDVIRSDSADTSRADDLVARAASGELSAAEFEAARSDHALAAEIDGALDAAAAVQQSLAVPPPAHLRDSVLAAIEQEPQDGALHDGASQRAPGSGPSRSDETEHPALQASGDELAARRRRRWVGGALAAAAAVVFVVGAAVVVIDDDRADPIAAVVDADDRTVRAFDGSIGGDLELVYSPSAAALVVTGTGVVAVPPDVTLQLWLVDEEGAVSIGTFRPDADGSVSTRFDDVDPTGFVIGVTREPLGGSDVPTLPILATA